MAAKLTQRMSLNRISEEQQNGEKATVSNEEKGQNLRHDVKDEQKRSRKISQFEVKASRPLGPLAGVFTTTHTDNPGSIRASNSVTFSLSRRRSSARSDASNKHSQDHETANINSPRAKATFQLRPAKLFNVPKVREVIKEVFENEFYNSDVITIPTNLLCKNLTEAIKMKTRRLNYDRYKIIVHVFMGTKDNLTMKVTSRCVWDERWDNYADYMYEAKDYYILGVVHGIYKE